MSKIAEIRTRLRDAIEDAGRHSPFSIDHVLRHVYAASIASALLDALDSRDAAVRSAGTR